MEDLMAPQLRDRMVISEEELRRADVRPLGGRLTCPGAWFDATPKGSSAVNANTVQHRCDYWRDARRCRIVFEVRQYHQKSLRSQPRAETTRQAEHPKTANLETGGITTLRSDTPSASDGRSPKSSCRQHLICFTFRSCQTRFRPSVSNFNIMSRQLRSTTLSVNIPPPRAP